MGALLLSASHYSGYKLLPRQLVCANGTKIRSFFLATRAAIGRNKMVWDATSILKGIDTATSVAQALRSLVKGTKGLKRRLLLELQANIQLISLYTQGSAPIDKIIRKLDVTHCRAALESDFNFKSLKRERVSKALARRLPQFEAYVGWNTEQLFTNIYLKIKELQHIVDIDSDNKRYRKNVRLLNVLKLMLLLLEHLKS